MHDFVRGLTLPDLKHFPVHAAAAMYAASPDEDQYGPEYFTGA